MAEQKSNQTMSLNSIKNIELIDDLAAESLSGGFIVKLIK